MNNFWLEAFGYLGTLFVLMSMMMTSMEKLRWFNMVGSVISMIYAILMHTWPVVLLNLGMIIINAVQLIRVAKKENEGMENPV